MCMKTFLRANPGKLRERERKREKEREKGEGKGEWGGGEGEGWREANLVDGDKNTTASLCQRAQCLDRVVGRI